MLKSRRRKRQRPTARPRKPPVPQLRLLARMPRVLQRARPTLKLLPLRRLQQRKLRVASKLLEVKVVVPRAQALDLLMLLLPQSKPRQPRRLLQTPLIRQRKLLRKPRRNKRKPPKRPRRISRRSLMLPRLSLKRLPRQPKRRPKIPLPLLPNPFPSPPRSL